MIGFKWKPSTGHAWSLTVPGWLVFKDKWGVRAVRVPYPWDRFGVPGDRNHYRTLIPSRISLSRRNIMSRLRRAKVRKLRD